MDQPYIADTVCTLTTYCHHLEIPRATSLQAITPTHVHFQVKFAELVIVIIQTEVRSPTYRPGLLSTSCFENAELKTSHNMLQCGEGVLCRTSGCVLSLAYLNGHATLLYALEITPNSMK